MKIKNYFIPILVLSLIVIGIYAQNISFSNPANKVCDIDNLRADNVQPALHEKVTFDFSGNCPECTAVWNSNGGTPASGILNGGDGRFSVVWTTPGKKIVTVTCGSDTPLTQEINVRDKCIFETFDDGPRFETWSERFRWRFDLPDTDGHNLSRIFTKRCLNGVKVDYWWESWRKRRYKERIRSIWQPQTTRDENCKEEPAKARLIDRRWAFNGDPNDIDWDGDPYKRHRAEKSQVCPNPPGGGGGNEGEEENDDNDCEEPAEANTGEVDFSGDEEKFICVDEDQNEYKLDFIYRIVAHNTPRARTLFGKLKLELVEGDDVADIFYDDQPYTYGTNIDVDEPGHRGCGHHFNHGGRIAFTFKPKLDANGQPKEGTIKVKGICDPDLDDGGDGVPTKTPTLTLHFVKFNALIDSDNDGTIEEDEDEDVEEDSPGKIVACNSSDSDSDRIPDFADGYSINEEEGSDRINSDSKFTPIEVKIPQSLIDSGRFSSEDLMLKFTYSANNPNSGIIVDDEETPTETIKRYYRNHVGNLRIWAKDANETRKAEDVAAEGDFINTGEEYKLSWLPSPGQGGILTLYLEAINPSLGTGMDSLVVSLIEAEDNTVICSDELKITSVDPRIVADWDRDGKINNLDWFRSNDKEPWVIWLNEDSDKDAEENGIGTSENDFPVDPIKQDADFSDMTSNGIRDLVDFFPVHLDIQETLDLLDPLKYSYFISSGNVKLMSTTMSASNTSAYLKTNQAFDYADNELTFVDLGLNTELTREYLQDVKFNRNSGIVLIEGSSLGSSSTSDLKLTITPRGKTENIVAEIILPLRVANVMGMIKHSNFRSLTGSNEGFPNQIKETVRPACMNSEDTLFWVHGYNVDGDAAISTFSEIFKRFFHSGFNGHFYGVTWDGTPRANLPDLGPPHYHQNVVNAMGTAPEYKKLVNQVYSSGKGKVFVAGHSMGNIINNLAIQSGMNYDKYFSIDAVVAKETHEPSTPLENQIIDLEMITFADWLAGLRNWKDYWVFTDENEEHPARRLLASEWYRLFPESDERSKLTWRGLFKDVPSEKVYNFFSKTEDVLRKNGSANILLDGPGGLSYYTWVKNEKFKGIADYKVPGAALIGGGLSPFMGWGYNQDYMTGLFGTMEPENTLGITKNQLMTNPFFSLFRKDPITLGNSDLLESDKGFDTRRLIIDVGGQSPSDYLKSTLSSVLLSDYYSYNEDIHDNVTVRDFLLAEALPATTNAVGQEEDPSLKRFGETHNIDMSTSFKTPKMEWPRGRFPGEIDTEWKHSDIKDISYQHVYKFYHKLVDIMTEED